jgi:hypothetical protein
MSLKSLFLTLLFFSLLACNNVAKTTGKKQPKPVQEPVISLQKPIKLNTAAAKKYAHWKDYQNFKEHFDRFLKTTPSEAFSNAKELNTLALRLKDSLRIKSLKVPAFMARLDVLQSETMRLQDMMTIPNIKSKAVKEQLVKILNVFNATNAKLNNLVMQRQLEKDIRQLEDSI